MSAAITSMVEAARLVRERVFAQWEQREDWRGI